MDLQTYSQHLGTFFACVASRKKSDEQSAAVAFRELRNDREANEAFNAFLENAGLQVVSNHSATALRVFPADSSSPFAYDAEDFKRAGKTPDRPLLGFVTLCVLAAFYPTRSALNQGLSLEVTVEKVIAMINSMISYAEESARMYGDDVLPKLAERFKKLSDDVDGPKDSGRKATHISKCLSMLVEDGLVSAMDGGRYYLPTESLRLLSVERVEKLKTTTLGQILSDYYDQNETLNDNEESI